MNLFFYFFTNNFLYKKYRQNFVLKSLSMNFINYFFLLNGIKDRNGFYFYYLFKAYFYYGNKFFNFLCLLKKKILFLFNGKKNLHEKKILFNFFDINFNRFFSVKSRDLIFLMFKLCFFFFRIKSFIKFFIFIYLFFYLFYFKFGLTFYLDFFFKVPFLILM